LTPYGKRRTDGGAEAEKVISAPAVMSSRGVGLMSRRKGGREEERKRGRGEERPKSVSLNLKG
jgi:hypothetical protein